MNEIDEREIVINVSFGGYSISALATKLLAEKKGKKCYFFEYSMKDEEYKLITLDETKSVSLWFAYSVSNPQIYNLDKKDKDGLYTEANKRSNEISLDYLSSDRTDTDLINVIKTIGAKANGKYAKLKIVKIPINIEWEIEEYDGFEHIAEKHRTWR